MTTRYVQNAPTCMGCGHTRGECRCRRAVRNAKQKEKTFQDYAAFYGVETDPAADPVGAVKELLAAMDGARAMVAGEATDPEDLGPGGDMGADEATEDMGATSPAAVGNRLFRSFETLADDVRGERDAQDCYPPPQRDYAELVANANERERQRRGQGGRQAGVENDLPVGYPPML